MSDVPALAGGVGGGMAVGALVWFGLLRYRVRQDVRDVLASPDPSARIAAVDVVATHGLAPVAKILLERVHHEDDEAVLDAIAAAVVRTQWEPPSSPALVELRVWAAQRRQAAASAPAPAAASAPAPAAASAASPAAGSPGARLPTAGSPAGVSSGAGSPAALAPSAASSSVPTPSRRWDVPPPEGLDARPTSDAPAAQPTSGAAAAPSGRGAPAAQPTSCAAAPAQKAVPQAPEHFELAGSAGTGSAPVVVVDADSVAGAVVTVALCRAGHRVVAVLLRPAEHPGLATVPVASDPAALWRVAAGGPPRTVGPGLVALAAAAGARAVLAPTQAALEAVAPARYALTLVGAATMVPMPCDPDGVPRAPGQPDLPAQVAAAALAGHPVPDRPTSPVRGFVAEVVADGRRLVGQVVLEPVGPLSAVRPRADSVTPPHVPPTWPERSGAMRARTVTDPAVLDAVAAAVCRPGNIGPFHVRGALTDGIAPWIVSVQTGFSSALPLVLATGSDLVEQWLATTVGDPVDGSRLSVPGGLTVEHPWIGPARQGPQGRPARASTAPARRRFIGSGRARQASDG